jgi:hypothetical protein
MRGGLLVTSTNSSRLFPNQTLAHGIDISSLPQPIIDSVSKYHPAGSEKLWADHAPMLIQLLLRISPATAGNATRSLRSLFRLVTFRANQGFVIKDPSDFLTAETVESLTASRRANLPKRSVKNQPVKGEAIIDSEASHLRTIGQIINPQSNWPAQREKGKTRDLQPIYTDAEIDTYYQLGLRMQSTRKKRIALAALSLGIGAGLTKGEMHNVQIQHIFRDEEQITWISVLSNSPTHSPRLVPVASPWDGRLWHAIELTVTAFGEWALPVGRSVNAATENLNDLAFGKKTPALSITRMRSTWFVQRTVAGVWPTTLIRYAGLTGLDTIFKAMKMLPEQNLEEAMAAMVRFSRCGN